VYRAAHPVEVRSLADLRAALKRMYLAGRIGIALGMRTDRGRPNESIVNAVVIEEDWAIIV
jgi:hypothetical protein